jgi:MFS transporter, ACS family, tartrate transporter
VTGQDAIFAKCARRLLPFLVILQIAYVLDRVNVAFAALTMNRDLGFSPAIFGFGAGIYFAGYILSAVPASLVLARLGAKRWVFCIMMIWGAVSSANALVQDTASFYVLRFLLGAAEAGFVPGMILYLTYWFPHSYRARYTAIFIAAAPLANIVGGPLSSFILEMDGIAGLAGWQWLFLLEGLPSCLLAIAALGLLPDGPADAAWLSGDEKTAIQTRLSAEETAEHHDFLTALRDPRVLAFGAVALGIYTALFGMVLWLPQIVRDLGFSNFSTGFVVALPYAVGIGSMYLWGRSSDARAERNWHVALAAMVAAIGFAVAGLAQSTPAMLLSLTIAAAGGFATLGPFFGLLSSFLRGTAAAGGIALVYSFGTGLGGFAGPVVLGLSKQETGQYGPGLALLAIGLVLSAGLVLLIGRFKRPALAA